MPDKIELNNPNQEALIIGSKGNFVFREGKYLLLVKEVIDGRIVDGKICQLYQNILVKIDKSDVDENHKLKGIYFTVLSNGKKGYIPSDQIIFIKGFEEELQIVEYDRNFNDIFKNYKGKVVLLHNRESNTYYVVYVDVARAGLLLEEAGKMILRAYLNDEIRSLESEDFFPVEETGIIGRIGDYNYLQSKNNRFPNVINIEKDGKIIALLLKRD